MASIATLIKSKTLKQELDGVDEQVKRDVKNGFKDSRKRIEIGMWEKGKVIAGEFRGVKSPASWRELERQTGRNHESLKDWFELYMKYPQKEKYLPIAETKAEEWTKKVFVSLLGLDGHKEKAVPEDTSVSRSFVNCFHQHYSGMDPLWTENCSGCLRLGLCRQISEIIEKAPMLRKERCIREKDS